MDTSGQGRQDTTRGGTGTISRQPVKPAQGTRVRPEPRTPLAAAPAPPAPPRNLRPVPPVAPKPPAQSAPARAVSSPPLRQAARAAGSQHRMPFVLMLCGLLTGALVSALVISTTLAEGSFQITRLQKSTNLLARQEQVLKEKVAQAQSAQVIENRALKLGLRPQGVLRFIDLKTGKISNDRGSAADRAIHVPGYTP